MLKLMSEETLPQSEAVPLALQWANLDYVRHFIGLIALLAALKAFSLFSASSEGRIVIAEQQSGVRRMAGAVQRRP
jgi:hypothetical protein